MITMLMDSNLTIQTDGPDNALHVLNNAVRGKSLSYDAPFYCKEERHPSDGVQLWLSDKPEDGDDTVVFITPTLSAEGKPELSIDVRQGSSPYEFLDDDEEEAPSVAPCSVDILGISLGEEGLLIIPREVRMQCEPLVNVANALMNALNDLPVSTVDKNTIALLAADLMAQAEQEGVKNGVEAYTDFTHDMTPGKFAKLVKSVKDAFMPS